MTVRNFPIFSSLMLSCTECFRNIIHAQSQGHPFLEPNKAVHPWPSHLQGLQKRDFEALSKCDDLFQSSNLKKGPHWLISLQGPANLLGGSAQSINQFFQVIFHTQERKIQHPEWSTSKPIIKPKSTPKLQISSLHDVYRSLSCCLKLCSAILNTLPPIWEAMPWNWHFQTGKNSNHFQFFYLIFVFIFAFHSIQPKNQNQKNTKGSIWLEKSHWIWYHHSDIICSIPTVLRLLWFGDSDCPWKSFTWNHNFSWYGKHSKINQRQRNFWSSKRIAST